MREKFVGSTTFRTTGQFLVRPQTLWPAAAQLEMLCMSPGGKREGTETPNCPPTGDRSVTQERCPDVKVDEASWGIQQLDSERSRRMCTVRSAHRASRPGTLLRAGGNNGAPRTLTLNSGWWGRPRPGGQLTDAEASA